MLARLGYPMVDAIMTRLACSLEDVVVSLQHLCQLGVWAGGPSGKVLAKKFPGDEVLGYLSQEWHCHPASFPCIEHT